MAEFVFQIKVRGDIGKVTTLLIQLRKEHKYLSFPREGNVFTVGMRMEGEGGVSLLREIFNIPDIEVLDWRALKQRLGDKNFTKAVAEISPQKLSVLFPGINVNELTVATRALAERKGTLKRYRIRVAHQGLPPGILLSKVRNKLEHVFECKVVPERLEVGASFVIEVPLNKEQVVQKLGTNFKGANPIHHRFLEVTEISEN